MCGLCLTKHLPSFYGKCGLNSAPSKKRPSALFFSSTVVCFKIRNQFLGQIIVISQLDKAINKTWLTGRNAVLRSPPPLWRLLWELPKISITFNGNNCKNSINGEVKTKWPKKPTKLSTSDFFFLIFYGKIALRPISYVAKMFVAKMLAC